jgi:mannose-6-phosphate isomerase class I
MASVVRLKYGDIERSTRLVNNQLHIPTIKDMFALSSIDIDGVAEPADDRGFTFATYMSGSILDISGTPAQAAVMSGMSLAVFCHAAEQMIFCARQCTCLLTLCLAKCTSTIYKLSQQQHKCP